MQITADAIALDPKLTDGFRLSEIWEGLEFPEGKAPQDWLYSSECVESCRAFVHAYMEWAEKMGAEILWSKYRTKVPPSPIVSRERVEQDPIKAAFILGHIQEHAECFSAPGALAMEYAAWAKDDWLGEDNKPQ